MKLFPRFLAVCLLVAFPIVVDGQPYTLPEGSPACLQEKLTAFGQKMLEDSKACYEGCTGKTLPDPNDIFEDLSADDYKTCNQFQANIMDPVCSTELAKCCPWVVPAFIDVMNCIANEGLEATPAPCQFTCTASSSRRELSGSISPRQRVLSGLRRGRKLLTFYDAGDGSVTEPAPTTLIDECANELDPGTGKMATPDEMADIMAKGDMVACFAGQTVVMVNKKVAYDKYKDETVVDMEWEIPEVGFNLGAAIGILLSVCGCCGLMCAGICYKRAGDSSSPKPKKEAPPPEKEVEEQVPPDEDDDDDDDDDDDSEEESD